MTYALRGRLESSTEVQRLGTSCMLWPGMSVPPLPRLRSSSRGCPTPAGSDSDRGPEAARQHNRYLTPMDVPETADARTLAAWDALADRVAAALRRAGLPVTGPTTDVTNGRTGRKYGAFVEVDPIADSAGGVFVFWQAPDELARPSREALLAGRLNDPAIQRYGRVVAIMIDAIKRLLAESKFAIEDAATVNDLRPLEIHVRSAELDPPPASLSAKGHALPTCWDRLFGQFLPSAHVRHRPLPVAHRQSVTQPATVVLMPTIRSVDYATRISDLGTRSRAYRGFLVPARQCRAVRRALGVAGHRFHRVSAWPGPESWDGADRRGEDKADQIPG